MTGSVKSVVVFDSRTPNLQHLWDGLASQVNRSVLDPSRDGLEQIREILQACAPVDELHLVGHGAPGTLYLGNRVVTAETLQEAGRWRDGLAENAEISLYGCEVARGDTALLQRLAQLTGASVAASQTRVGAAERGGRWVLDAVVGAVRGSMPWTESVLAAYPGVLNIIEVGNQVALQAAFDSVNPGDIISLTRDIDISSPLILTRDATIYGNGYAIDGGGSTYLMRGTGGNHDLAVYDITFRNGYEYDPAAYPAGLSNNSVNLAGSKVTFADNVVVAKYSPSVSMNALGAAIYGGGSIELADSKFIGNETLLDGEIKDRIRNEGVIYFGSIDLSDVYVLGTAIYAIGSDIRLLDTTFSNNYGSSEFVVINV
ncbi:DUF4347 domain-containing protein [Baaleninema simplex]|uniref:DUF4347 domain-containing protein n=1 Tax=Baaleninema simplex TaxID=2862350 RepID=UPI000348C1C7|nr:DUF4347 domain-containing protein [Baaleninema simplex]